MRNFLLLVLFLFYNSIIAQPFQDFGIKFGINSSNSSFITQYVDYPSHNRKIGLTFGVFTEYNILKQFFLEPNLLYSQKGFNLSIEEGGVRFHFISFETLGKYETDFWGIEPFISFGPRVDFLLDVTSDMKHYANELLFIYWDNKDTYNDFNFGGTLSAGFEFRILHETVLIYEFKYNYDFTDFKKVKSFIREIKNNSFGLNLGIKF